jgi:TatA/E family protein of Tat protein translocase
MGPFSWDKMVLVFLVVLVLFGPKELPKIARTIAKFMNDFKRARSELQETWQRELSALEHETQDIRKELDITNDLTQTSAGYTDTSYHHDSSYDYGAYGYPDSSSVAAAEAAAEPAAKAATETAMDGPAVEAAPATAEATPVIAAAPGTVPTNVSTAPAADPHDEPAASL